MSHVVSHRETSRYGLSEFLILCAREKKERVRKREREKEGEGEGGRGREFRISAANLADFSVNSPRRER
jgi:hypothetical protein